MQPALRRNGVLAELSETFKVAPVAAVAALESQPGSKFASGAEQQRAAAYMGLWQSPNLALSTKPSLAKANG